MPCHGGTRAQLDRCSQCHLYHNRGLEQEQRRPVEKLVRQALNFDFFLALELR